MLRILTSIIIITGRRILKRLESENGVGGKSFGVFYGDGKRYLSSLTQKDALMVQQEVELGGEALHKTCHFRDINEVLRLFIVRRNG